MLILVSHFLLSHHQKHSTAQAMLQINAKELNFAEIGSPRRIWAISAIHSQAASLSAIHDSLLQRIQPGDRILYHGNYIGYGRDTIETIDEILAFRRLVLSMPAMLPDDFIFLRGRQEEMFHKLLQLQFAPNPEDILIWMLDHGLAPTLQAYNISYHDGLETCRSGIMDITKWTATIRQNIRRHPGHDTFGTVLKRAAFSDIGSNPLLFVHSGIDTEKSLTEQGDCFWWASKKFSNISAPYTPFHKIVRGYDPEQSGFTVGDSTVSIDGGCGFGGALVCAAFEENGEITEILEH